MIGIFSLSDSDSSSVLVYDAIESRLRKLIGFKRFRLKLGDGGLDEAEDAIEQGVVLAGVEVLTRREFVNG